MTEHHPDDVKAAKQYTYELLCEASETLRSLTNEETSNFAYLAARARLRLEMEAERKALMNQIQRRDAEIAELEAIVKRPVRTQDDIDSAIQAERERISTAAIEVTYVESGSFQGGEEDVFDAGIMRDEDVLVIRKSVLNPKDEPK